MTTEQTAFREPTPREIVEAEIILKGLRHFGSDEAKARWIAACLRLIRNDIPLVRFPED